VEPELKLFHSTTVHLNSHTQTLLR